MAHEHQCRQCHPERFPRIPEPGAPYIAVDNGGGWVPAWATVWRDGRRAADFAVEFNGHVIGQPVHTVYDWCVTEALAGEVGWLVRAAFPDPTAPGLNTPERRRCFVQHRCRGRWGTLSCEQAEYGRVAFVRADGLRVDG